MHISTTELDLQREIAGILSDEIIPELSIFEEGEMKVWLQNVPSDKTQYEYDEDGGSGEDEYLPCCVVVLRGGNIKTAASAQETTIEIDVIIKDYENDGYQKAVITVQRIRDYFERCAGIRGKFRLKHPLEWVMNGEDFSAPYHVACVMTVWETEVMEYTDEFL